MQGHPAHHALQPNAPILIPIAPGVEVLRLSLYFARDLVLGYPSLTSQSIPPSHYRSV